MRRSITVMTDGKASLRKDELGKRDDGSSVA